MARSPIHLWLPVIVYMAGIFYVSSLHQAPLPGNVSDKSAHGLAYVGLGLLTTRASARGLPARLSWRAALMAVAIVSAYGASDELHQLFVPGRTADIYDLFADMTGAVAATAACWLWGILSIRSGRLGAGPHDV